MQQGWERAVPFLSLSEQEIGVRLERALPGTAIQSVESVLTGLRNTTYRVWLRDRVDPVAVRLYTAEPSACAKDLALAALLPGAVPMASIVAADPDGDPPLAVMEWIDGQRFDTWLPSAAEEDVRAAAWSAGRILAAIHAVTFPGTGFLVASAQGEEPPHPSPSPTQWVLEVGEPFLGGGAGWAEYMRMFLFERGVEEQLGAERTARVWDCVQGNAARLDPLAQDRSLVHADFKPPNLLVRQVEGVWAVVGVLDWEFAFAGPPLLDVGLFLRFEQSFPSTYRSGFVDGYTAAGGALPADWRPMSRLLDLLSMCSLLDQTGVRSALIADICRLVDETLEDLDFD